ncbi:uncharacterized protein LOC104003155 isoform X2 [Pan troglodytes]|uniref:uncharacterized protein LOC104003155 isoform X2 n=1 Tax=Pan troglodytes TaxID=9598 RepID=UPI003013BFF3
MEWRCLRQSWPSLNFMIFLGSLSLFLTLLSMIRHLFLGGGCWLQDVNSSLLFTQGTPICRGITWILQSQPWPSVMVKATDVRCQPLASRLTVEGYSTDWTESFILEVKKALVGSQFFDWNSISSCLGI